MLTAAHCADGNITSQTFTINGVVRTVDARIVHPSWTTDLKTGYDIALLHLATYENSVTPAVLNTATTEVGLVGTHVGFGASGTGTTGATGATGTKRAGTNRIDGTGDLIAFNPTRLLVDDFDSPTDFGESVFGPSTPTDMEYMIAGGDSGGGLFAEVGGQNVLVGVHSFIASYDGATDASYGDVSGSTRVSQFITWINTQRNNFVYARTWKTAANGNWSTAANWNEGVTPTETRDASFALSGTYTVSLNNTATARDLLQTVGSVTFNLNNRTLTLSRNMTVGGATSVPLSTIIASNGTLTVPGTLTVGSTGSGGTTMTIGTGSTVNLNGEARIGNNVNSPVTMIVDRSNTRFNYGGASELVIGFAGPATLTVSSSATWNHTAASSLIIGKSFNASATVNAGVVNVTQGAVVVGQRTTGSMNITSGGSVNSLSGAVGHDTSVSPVAGGNGTVTLTGLGSQWLITNRLDIGGTGTGVVSVGSGATLHVNGTLSVNNASSSLTVLAGGNASAATFSSAAATTISGNADFGLISSTAGLTVGSGGTVSAGRIDVASLNLTGALTITGTTASTVDSLTVNPGGRLDLGLGSLVIDYAAGNSPEAAIAALVQQGLGGVSGIFSSDETATGWLLGYAEASEVIDFGGASTSVWRGQSVDATSVVLGLTLPGDANFDETVDFVDLGIVLGNYDLPGDWFSGDFNHTGMVDFDDLGLLLGAYGQTIGAADVPLLAAVLSTEELMTLDAMGYVSVPEPGTLGVVMGGAVMMLRRRRPVHGDAV